MKQIVLVLAALTAILIFAGCASIDNAIHSFHDVPDGLYETEYARVIFNPDISGHWAVADMVAEKADKLVINTFRTFQRKPNQEFYFEIVIISSKDFPECCPKTSHKIYTEELKPADTACSRLNESIIYLAAETLREDTLVHEIVHLVVNSFDPVLARNEEFVEKISLQVWR